MRKYISVKAEPHTPPYKIHRYFARRPWNVFRQMIELFSKANDIVLDPFCGGGVTIYEGIKLGRKLVGLDLNPLPIFIVKNMVKKDSNIIELDDSYQKIEAYIKYLYSDYNSIGKDGVSLIPALKRIPIEWNELAFYMYCNLCGAKIVLSNNFKYKDGKYYCSNARCKGSKNQKGFVEPKNCKRDGYVYLYSIAFSPEDNCKIVVKYTDDRLKDIKRHIAFLNRERKRPRKSVREKRRNGKSCLWWKS